MPEVVSSIETTVEVLSPVDMTTLQTVTFTEDVSISERPVYAMRGLARSGAQSAPILRSAGQVSMRRNLDTAAVYDELRRWRYGVLLFALASDLKGKRLRHPHIRITKRNADGVTVERRTAYDCKLSDYTLNKPATGLVGESFTIDSLGGIDTPGADHYEPAVPLAFFRTGSKTYISTAGTLTTATDSKARIGLPFIPQLRNLYSASDDFSVAAWLTDGYTVAFAGEYAGSNVFRLSRTATENWRGVSQSRTLTSGSTYTLSAYVKADSISTARLECYVGASPTLYVWGNFNLSTGATGSLASSGSVSGATSSISSVGDGWYRVSITFTVTATLGGAVSAKLQTGGASVGESILYCKPQFEASTLTAYQETSTLTTPTVAVSSVNGAGLVLEGGTINKLTSNQATGTDTLGNTTGFSAAASTHLNSGATLSSNTTASNVFQGSRSLQVTTTAASASQGCETTATAVSASKAISLSAVVKATAGTALTAIARDYTNGVNSTAYSWVATGGFDFVPVSITTGALAVTDLRLTIRTNSAVATTFYVDALQIEENPFATSWVDGTRNADVCGIVSPHNEILYSNALDQWAAIGAKSAGASVAANNATAQDGTLTADTLTLGASDYIQQFVTPPSVGGTTRTFAVVLKAGTLSGSVKIRINDQSGVLIGSAVTCALTSSFQTYFVTVTPSASTTQLKLTIIQDVGTGTIIFDSARLVQGSHPGVYVRTTDTAIAKPADAILDAAWVQNGSLKFRILPPANSTGKTIGYVGAMDGSSGSVADPTRKHFGSTLLLCRNADRSDGRIDFDRRHNSTTGTAGIAGRGFLGYTSATFLDGAPHDVELIWKNYEALDPATGQWRRYMPQELWIDGVLVASQDVAALYGATEWATPDATRIISDGNVNSVLSQLVLGYPSLPAGATPYGRAA